MTCSVNSVFPNPNHIIPYVGLLIERVLFDFRRGLPVFLNNDQQGYFIKPTEFTLCSDNYIIIKGNEIGEVVIEKHNLAIDLSTEQAQSLLSLIKRSELVPSLTIYPCDDFQLKKCVTEISIDDLINIHISCNQYNIEKITETILPTTYDKNSRLIAYRIVPSFYEYYALIINQPDFSQAVNLRLHAECLTGDLLGSLRCDCQPQLHKALSDFAASKQGGVIIYIRQEGRNIGLMNKLKAYNLQNQGYDTVDANLMLGFKLDERDYQASALILKDLSISQVNLYTNNPEKIKALQEQNIDVINRIEHYTQSQKYNETYIQTKQERIGHLPQSKNRKLEIKTFHSV
jgi:GTP cyclohydrolase II